MTLWDLVKRNMRIASAHHFATGVLACLITACLTAGLTVSGAIQKSIRNHAVSRYGRIEAALLSRAPLPADLHKRLPRLEKEYLTVPVWQESAVAESVSTSNESSESIGTSGASETSGSSGTIPCRVFAIPPDFGRFGWHGTRLHLEGNAVAIGADLAARLGVSVGDGFTVSVPVPTRQADATPPPDPHRFPERAHPHVFFPPPPTLALEVKEILDHPAPGAFGLRHDRIDTMTLFVDHAWYMEQTGRDAVANRIFFGSAQDTRLRLNHRAVEITLQGTLTIADYGMTLSPEPDAEGVWRLTGKDLPPIRHTLRAELHPFVLDETPGAPDVPGADVLRFRMTPATSFEDYIAHRPRNERNRLLAMEPEEAFDLFLREALWNSALGYRLSMLHKEAESAARGSLGFAGFSILLALPLLIPMALGIRRIQRRAYDHLRPVLRILLTFGFTRDQTRGQVLTGGLAAVLWSVLPGALLGLALAHIGVWYLVRDGAGLVGGMPVRLLPDFLFLSTGIGGGMILSCGMVWLAARPAKRWTLSGLREPSLPCRAGSPERFCSGTPASERSSGSASGTPDTGMRKGGFAAAVWGVLASDRVRFATLILIYIATWVWMGSGTASGESIRSLPNRLVLVRTVLPVPGPEMEPGQGEDASPGQADLNADGEHGSEQRFPAGVLGVGLLVEGESIAPGTPTRPLRPRILGLPSSLLARIDVYVPDGKGFVTRVSGGVLGEARSDHHIPAAANGYSAYWLLHRGLGTTLTVPGRRGAPVPVHLSGVFQTLPARDTIVMSAENVRQFFSHLPAARVFLLPVPDPDADTQLLDRDAFLHSLAAYHPTLHTLEEEHAAYRRWVDGYRRMFLGTLVAGLVLLLVLEAMLPRFPATPVRLPFQPDPERG